MGVPNTVRKRRNQRLQAPALKPFTGTADPGCRPSAPGVRDFLRCLTRKGELAPVGPSPPRSCAQPAVHPLPADPQAGRDRPRRRAAIHAA